MITRRRALRILAAQTRIEARLWREYATQCGVCGRQMLCRAALDAVSTALDLEDVARAARRTVPASVKWLADTAERVRRRVLAPEVYGEVERVDVFLLGEATARVLAEMGEMAGAAAPPMRPPPGMIFIRSREDRGQG